MVEGLVFFALSIGASIVMSSVESKKAEKKQLEYDKAQEKKLVEIENSTQKKQFNNIYGGAR